jgi:metallo-beta-lactamase family protein
VSPFSILHHGAVDGVTGSCHELVLGERTSVLVDCGLFQGDETSGEGASARRLEIDFDASRVRALVVTHCHIDHVGRIPYLLEAGFQGPILCTEPTAQLLPLVLEDAIRVGGLREPRQADRLLAIIADRTVAVPYGRWVPVPQARVPGGGMLRVRFQPAGHILGSAYVECEVPASPPRGSELMRDPPAVGASVADESAPTGASLAPPGRPADPAPSGRSEFTRDQAAGAASTTVSVAEGSAPGSARSTRVKVLFSGDLGGPFTPLLPTPKPPFGTDVLVLESTYGDRLHEDRRNRRARLKALVERCVANHGAILIPAFSIGRTQELLYELEEILHRYVTGGRAAAAARAAGRAAPPVPGAEQAAGGRGAGIPGGERAALGERRPLDWSALPIIVDSPLAARFTQAYSRLRGHWDAEAKRTLRKGRHPLSFEQVITVDRHEDHLKVVRHLADTARPAIVLAGSGMCAGGRIVNYLKALIGDPRTDVVFVGYQAEGTPGRAIQTYGPKGGWVDLDGERHAIRARVHTLPGYSAHADQAALVGFVRRMRHRPGEIRLVHGSEPAKRALRTALAPVCPEAHVWIP